MDIRSAAALLRVSDNGLRNMVSRGAIPARKITVGDRDDIWDLDPAVVEHYRLTVNRRADAHTRFWRKVRMTDTCWLWIGAASPLGYGAFGATKGKLVRAHRWSWEQVNGPIPDGLHIDHLCNTPACVRPDHMEPVTPTENTRRAMARFGHHNTRKTHCIRGHSLDDAYVYTKPRPVRQCRTCRRLRDSAA